MEANHDAIEADAELRNQNEHDAQETSPLLPNGNNSEQETQWDADFAHLPWYKRPSVFWVLGPFFFMTLAFGGSVTPKINLILEIVCQKYNSEQGIATPAILDDDQCRNPAVQARVSMFTLYASLIAGFLSAITSPKLGALSDRYGRKPILILTSLGTICSEVITIFAALYPQTFPLSLLLMGFAIDGLTGSFILAMAIANSYAADCTPPAMRNVAFGYFHGCLFTGLAFGPVLAGYLVKATGKIVIVFYFLLAVHVGFVLFIGILVPESLSRRRTLATRERHQKDQADLTPATDWKRFWDSINLLAPLKILWPTGPGTTTALRRNLILLAAVDTILFGVAMGSMTVLIIYTNYQFGWKTFESARFMSIVNSSRVFCLVAVLPVLTKYFRGTAGKRKRTDGTDRFDLVIIRVAVLFDTLGYFGYALARNEGLFTLSGVIAAIGGIGAPTLQSALTKHVPADQTGQLLGASGLLHSLARVVAPTVFNAIYSATVGKYTQAVYVCLTATFVLAFIASWLIQPHGKCSAAYAP
ncbi:MFS general substrate transporter [Piedraia hortae CBS 480.64]|uniref:MFS general substrate transporter n=1 Tax=Piedraia hortae CBS 480.64 TaxID=1314780 RepID=A0A6A7C4X6_9PEZI|nr:MFS general substrate transporter [Piedraia hortae CBS 480.64]